MERNYELPITKREHVANVAEPFSGVITHTFVNERRSIQRPECTPLNNQSISRIIDRIKKETRSMMRKKTHPTRRCPKHTTDNSQVFTWNGFMNNTNDEKRTPRIIKPNNLSMNALPTRLGNYMLKNIFSYTRIFFFSYTRNQSINIL